MKVLLQGNPVELEGVQPEVGQVAPNFALLDLEDNKVELNTLVADKPVIVSVVPDIDTAICALQTKRFNQEASKIDGVHFVTISNNTKEEQSSWCGAEGVTMTMLRDSDLDFAKSYGLLIPAINRLARSIFVIDTKGNVVHADISNEVAEEPNYEAALEKAKSLI